MARFLHRNLSPGFRKWSRVLLACFWVAGLISGMIIYPMAGDSLVSLMPVAASGHVSIVNLLASVFLPFLFSAFAVFCSLPQLIFTIGFCKAFFIAFVSCAVLDAYGSAGWLIRWLLLFTDICSAAVLYAYWMRHISGEKRFSSRIVGLYFLAAALLAGVDFCFIAPFLRGVVLFWKG